MLVMRLGRLVLFENGRYRREREVMSRLRAVFLDVALLTALAADPLGTILRGVTFFAARSTDSFRAFRLTVTKLLIIEAIH